MLFISPLKCCNFCNFSNWCGALKQSDSILLQAIAGLCEKKLGLLSKFTGYWTSGDNTTWARGVMLIDYIGYFLNLNPLIFFCRMCQCQCTVIDVWRHASLPLPSFRRTSEAVGTKSEWGWCIFTGNWQDWIWDPSLTCHSQTPFYRQQLYMETLWRAMCSSWWFCAQSKSRHETESVFRRFWLPLHGWCPSTTVLVDRNVCHRSKSGNTWSLCTMKTTTQLWTFVNLDFIDYVELLHKPKLKLAEANFEKFCSGVSYKVRCLPRSCYK